MCLYPRYAKYSHIYKPNGKRDIFFVGAEKRFEPDTLIIPCGKCDECKLDYAREWSVRCQAESTLYKHNWFVTLTYNDENLPDALPVTVWSEIDKEAYYNLCDYIDDTILFDDMLDDKLAENRQLGVEMFMNPLVPEHLKQFMKSLRQAWQREYNHVGIRFFASGEYGSSSLRPHYHIILFNCPIFDLQNYKNNHGNPLFVSQRLNDIWHKGYVVIGKVSPQSCGYVARYNYKKQIKPQNIYGVPPEFVRMSRNPGIGYDYFVKNYEKLVKTQFSVHFNGREYRNVPYFRRLADGFDLDIVRYCNSINEVKNEIRDRSLDDLNLFRGCSSQSRKQNLLKNENLGIDKESQLLYTNRVKSNNK